jgi:serine phosphatase RsbU (regulator of sigma subunit)
LRVGAAKVAKYASLESGDTLEMVERPRGGLSFVLADGQTSGRGAKAISNMAARKVVSLLAEGVRDGAAARAAHDYLFTQYRGKVQADLTILSLDLVSKTIVLARNTASPALVRQRGEWGLVENQSSPVGIYAFTKPLIHEFPFELGTYVIVSTDGLWTAGGRELWDVLAFVRERATSNNDPSALADVLLAEARRRDHERPADDISVLVLGVFARESENSVRRLWVRVPI